MKKTVLIPLLACLFIFTQCKKDKNNPEPDNPYGLPNATQTGANVFACRVNANNWISESGSVALNARIFSDSINIWGSFGNTNDFDVFTLTLKSPIQIGTTYNLNNPSLDYSIIYTDQDCAGNLLGFYERYIGTSGTLKLTKLDLEKKVISGNFNCVITNRCGTLNITDGRFDIKYF